MKSIRHQNKTWTNQESDITQKGYLFFLLTVVRIQKSKKIWRWRFTFLTYKNFSMPAVKVDLGTAPITASFLSPLMKVMMVGMLRIPYWVATEGLSSVFNLKHLSFPAYCCASSPITGWIIRQGPHHGAQNSTSTGPSAFKTSDSHVVSFTVGTAILKANERG